MIYCILICGLLDQQLCDCCSVDSWRQGGLLFLRLFYSSTLYQFIINHIALCPPVTSTSLAPHNGVINLANLIKPALFYFLVNKYFILEI